MKRLLTVIAAIGLGFLPGSASAQSPQAQSPVTLGRIRLPHTAVLANGKELDAGVYDVRLTNAEPKPSTTAVPGMERRVQFIRRGTFSWRAKPVGNEVVNLVPASEIGKIQDQAQGVPTGGAYQILETPHDYVRIWFNRGATHYLIYLRAPNGE